jgi:excisionase family DNA binding protein
MANPELLTVSQAADALNASGQSIRNWIRAERLRGIRIGNRFLIPRDEVERMRGDLAAPAGESTWDYSPDAPANALVRPTASREPAGGRSEGLLGG